MRAAFPIATAAIFLAGPALADYGVRPIWNDFQPAVSTQYRPPDGGRHYAPPDTKTLIRASDRQFQDDKPTTRTRAPIPPASQTTPSASTPSATSPNSTLNKPPSQVGR